MSLSLPLFGWSRSAPPGGLSFLAAPVLTGCSDAPSQALLGAYFPAWMICLGGGVVITVVLRGLLVRWGVEALLPLPMLVHLFLAVALSFALWLVWLG